MVGRVIICAQKSREQDFEKVKEAVSNWSKDNTESKVTELYLMRDTDLSALTSYLLDQTPKYKEFINEITCALSIDSKGELCDSSILFGDRLVQNKDQYSQEIGSLKSIVQGDIYAVLKKVAKVFGLCVNVNISQVGGEKDQNLVQKISDS